MHKINTSFAKRYNSIKNHIGYVFNNRFFIQPITSESQLYNCLVYIHKNPISANIVSNYEDYTFSSYNEFIKNLNIITAHGCELIFGTSNNYLSTFEKIHKDRIIEDIQDVTEYIDGKYIINSFIKDSGQNLYSIKKDEKLLKELLIQLLEKSGLSMRKISILLKISRNTMMKLLK